MSKAAAGLSCEAIKTGLIGDRMISGAFFNIIYESLGRPEWLLKETPASGADRVPDQIRVRDYLAIMGNIATYASDPSYFIDYVVAGVPMYRGGLELGLQYAPNLLSALELIARHGVGRRPYHGHILRKGDGQVSIELVPTILIGKGNAILVEASLLVYHRLAAHCLARPVSEAVVEFRHGVPLYAPKLQRAFGCKVSFDAGRDAVNFPEPLCLQASPTYDANFWRTAQFRCREEDASMAAANELFDLRARLAMRLSEQRRVPRLSEMANEIGVSERTLIRRLQYEGLTYRGIVGELLKSRCESLLGNTDMALSDAAEELGFSDTSSFYRSFRRWYGVTPSQFRSSLGTGGKAS